jgi:hypothetical protein
MCFGMGKNPTLHISLARSRFVEFLLFIFGYCRNATSDYFLSDVGRVRDFFLVVDLKLTFARSKKISQDSVATQRM